MENTIEEDQLLNQKSRSYLRNEFLNVLSAITDQSIKIEFDKTKNQLDAVFRGSDFTFRTIAVKDLQTTIGKEPFSLLRINDIKSINYDLK